MYSDSRKAKHNSFAHHRANLLFTPAGAGNDAGQQSKPISDDKRLAGVDLRQRVSAGILGFVPTTAVVGA